MLFMADCTKNDFQNIDHILAVSVENLLLFIWMVLSKRLKAQNYWDLLMTDRLLSGLTKSNSNFLCGDGLRWFPSSA